MARSGSSWLGKGLSFAPGFTYYREPDNYHEVPEAKERFTWLYLTRDRDDPEYYRLMVRACTGRVATAFTLSATASDRKRTDSASTKCEVSRTDSAATLRRSIGRSSHASRSKGTAAIGSSSKE